MITIKSQKEIEAIRKSGKVVAQVLKELSELAKPGVSTLELDAHAERRTAELGAIPAFKGYGGFTHSVCISVNNEVVHGIPSSRILKEGDIVGLDFGVSIDGWYADSAITVPVGQVSDEALKLIETTKRSLHAAIAAIKPHSVVSDIGNAIEKEAVGYGIVKDYVGHGVGRKLHEAPQIPNYSNNISTKLIPGMVIAIEPMINAGTDEVKVLNDGWTVSTRDGKLSAHFEHTIAITEEGAEILTHE